MSRLSLKNDFKDGDVLHGDEINTNNDATVAAVNDNYEKILELQQLKADITNVDEKLTTKVDNSTFNDAINSLNTTKADKSALNLKADKTELATKADTSYVNSQLATKANTTYVDNQLAVKADTSYVNNQLNLKADKANTYTKDETVSAINSAITGKADTSYVKSQLATKANASDLGNLSQLQTNDKSSAVAAINEVLNEGSKIGNIDNLSITNNSNNEIQAVGVINRKDNATSIKTWTGTKEEYDALEVKNNSTLYYITDDFEEPEVVSNKVTTINASSTDKQYPSAKAVYDSIQGLTPGGSNDYNEATNKPQINGVTLQGNLSSTDLGIKQTYTANDIAFTDGETFQQKFDAGELTGPQGPQGNPGADGEQGPAGANATINGQNAINLVAGENIDIAQDGSNVTISSTGGSGANYTAGKNIEITEENVINNTIPYSKDGWSMAIGEGSYALSTGCTAVGTYSRINTSSDESVAIGLYSFGSKNGVTVGGRANAASYGVAIGYRNDNSVVRYGSISIGAQDIPSNSGISNASIAIGTNANAPKDNQFVLGSTDAPINEMKVVTSDGEKFIATTDLITALETKITELESRVAALEGGAE